MKSSVFHYEWKVEERKNYCALDLNRPESIIFAEHNEPIAAKAYE